MVRIAGYFSPMNQLLLRDQAAQNIAPLKTLRRGLNREEAALYIGVSPSMFDFLVSEGKMPKPRRIPSRNPEAKKHRVVWDVRALDRAFDELPGGEEDEVNPFDEDLA